METIPKSDFASVLPGPALSPFDGGEKTHKRAGNWEHMVLPPDFVGRNVEKVRETLLELSHPCGAGETGLGLLLWLSSLPLPHIGVTQVTLGWRTSGNCDLHARFTQFLFSK